MGSATKVALPARCAALLLRMKAKGKRRVGGQMGGLITKAVAALSALIGAWLAMWTGQMHFLALIGLAPLLLLLGGSRD